MQTPIIPNLPQTAPSDEHNQKLISNVHPLDWKNPTPADNYNMVVVGGGTAGLVTASIAAGVGGKVALIERALLGGDCLNVGCVPSKAIIRCARAASDVRRAGEYGIDVPEGEVAVDFPAIMKRMRKLRADISPHDSAKRFSELGIDVFIGDAAFTGSNTIEVAGATLNFAKACICTGGRAFEPPIEGLKDIGALTNETVFSLTEQPERIGIIGAGPIGAELAQSFARLGSMVHLIEGSDQILGREDRDAAAIVEASMQRDGVNILKNAKVTKFEQSDAGKVIHFEGNEQPSLIVDAILLATGRAPNVQNLGLEKAGVNYDARNGIEVDDKLRTSNKDIFAAGDVCTKYKFTHMADALSRIVVRNAFFFGRGKASDLIVPWCTYTEPEIAHVGMYVEDARAAGYDVETMQVDLDTVDRAILEGETDGFLKIHLKKGSDTILGATLVSSHAGDMISEMTLGMTNNIKLGSFSNTIHPYPTVAEIFRKAGDQYNRKRLTPFVAKMFKAWLRWRR